MLVIGLCLLESALIRRKYTYQEEENIRFIHRDLKLNVTNSTIEYKGQSTELSRNEFILLQLMIRNIGKIVSREDLIQVLWNEEQFVDDNTLTVNVNRVRRKIAALGLEEFIVTRNGMGYLIE